MRRLERLAERRHGVFTRAHARRVGVSDSALDRACRSHRVARVHPRVYAFAGTPCTERRQWMAAVDAAGAGGFLSGAAALRLLGVHKHCWERGPIDVVVARRRRPLIGVRQVRTDVRHPEEAMVLEGIEVLRLERLLVELAAEGVSEEVLCAIIDEGAFQRRFVVARMRRVLDRHAGRAGNGRLRRALQQYLDGDCGAATGFEERVGSRIAQVVTGRIERNRSRIFGGRRMRPDMYLPDVAIALEFDGMHGHRRPTRQRDDAARDAAYRRDGVLSLRIRDTHEEADTEAAISAILERQGGSRAT